MADEQFAVNIMRMVGAELHLVCVMQASREMYGKSYFALGQAEKISIDQAVLAMIGASYTAITPEFLAGQQASKQPVGFGIPPANAGTS